MQPSRRKADRSLARTLLLNTSSNVFQFLVYAALVFVMTPIYVRSLGEYDYGIWQILASLTGYFGILDLGLQATVSRYAARFAGLKDKANLSRLFSTATIMLCALATIPAAILLAFAMLYPEMLSPGSENTEKYRLILLIMSANVFLMLAGFSVSSFLEGLQRYVIKNNIIMAHSVILATLFVLLDNRFDPLVLLCVLSLVIGLSRLLMLSVVLLTTAGHRLRFRFADFDFGLGGELSRFGSKSFVQSAAATAEMQSDVLIIGGFLGPHLVVFYSIPDALARYIQNLGWEITHSFMPAFSALDAVQNRSAVKLLYLVSSKLTVLSLAPISIGVILLGDEFIAMWVGAEYIAGNELIIVALTVYYFVPMLNPFSTRFLTAIGKHGLLARLYPLRLVANWALSILLMQSYGIIGVAMGSVIPQIVVFPIVARVAFRHAGITVGEYVSSVLWPLILPSVGLIAVIFGAERLYEIDGFGTLIATAVAGTCVYFLIAVFFSVTRAERLTLKAQLLNSLG